MKGNAPGVKVLCGVLSLPFFWCSNFIGIPYSWTREIKKNWKVSCGNWKTKYLATPFKECFKTCLQYQTVSLSVSFQCDATSLPKMICCTDEESLSFPYRKMLEAKPWGMALRLNNTMIYRILCEHRDPHKCIILYIGECLTWVSIEVVSARFRYAERKIISCESTLPLINWRTGCYSPTSV